MSEQGEIPCLGKTVLKFGNLSINARRNRDSTHKPFPAKPVLDLPCVPPLLLTNRVALDCEMVGVGIDGKEHMLARVSVVNEHGDVLVDCYVKPQQIVKDYRTRISGVSPELIEAGFEFAAVRELVRKLIYGRILVGHALKNDLTVLKLGHPKHNIRDTSRYKPITKKVFAQGTPSLKSLTKHLLKVDIQNGTHDSVEDARAAMNIYLLFEQSWEKSVQQSRKY
ncbi:RNA exonuclease 4-like [Anopheles cruzii]|uniref:RNA exonuclease 4-like n=1 Tax=Anopheles cruzii TaxID=68878 RepID=UPI0022EC5D14|nr:RNA exonuclease 4-like [Anopheles cruzii]